MPRLSTYPVRFQKHAVRTPTSPQDAGTHVSEGTLAFLPTMPSTYLTKGHLLQQAITFFDV